MENWSGAGRRCAISMLFYLMAATLAGRSAGFWSGWWPLRSSMPTSNCRSACPLRGAGERGAVARSAHRVARGVLDVLAGYGWRLADISWEYVHGYRKVVRNFYSQLRIDDSVDDVLGSKRKMVHGRINHGEQFMDPTLRRQPTAYYCEKSGHRPRDPQPPEGDALAYRRGGSRRWCTLAAYGRAGDQMRIYEINEQVLELARSDFTFLSRAARRASKLHL